MHIRTALVATLVLGAACARAQDAPASVTITLTSYAFLPAAIVLKAGAPVRLHLVNAADKSHNFAAKEFFANAVVAPGDQAIMHDGEIELQEGAQADVTVTPTKAGSYALKCTHFLHASMGMTGTITIQ